MTESEINSKDKESEDPFKVIKSRLVTGQISPKDYEKMKKLLEKNKPPKNIESNSDYLQNFKLLVMRFAWSEIQEKEFKKIKKILDKEESKKSKKS